MRRIIDVCMTLVLLVFLENLLMLLAWAFIGDRAAVMCKKTFRKHDA